MLESDLLTLPSETEMSYFAQRCLLVGGTASELFLLQEPAPASGFKQQSEIKLSFVTSIKQKEWLGGTAFQIT